MEAENQQKHLLPIVFSIQILSVIFQLCSDILMKKFSFAIVGGGPAAFYSAKLLFRLSQQPIVHIFQKQLCPFGLIRYGVAPDHISIKKSETTLSQGIPNSNFQYFGNCEVTQKLLQDLQTNYSAIIYAYGASKNHTPDWITHQLIHNSNKIKYARDIVYWYNGHPSQQNNKQNIKNVKNIIIVGNGNVAVDIARIFLRKPSELQNTEISTNALQQLRDSNVINIQILGRRGVTHSAFAIKEIRQLHKLGIKLYAIREELERSLTEASQFEYSAIGDNFSSVVRSNKRKIEFIKKNFHIIDEREIEREKNNGIKKIFFRYLLNPCGVAQNTLKCEESALSGQPFNQVSIPTGKTVALNFDMLVISTGFEVESLNENHFDDKNKRVNNSNGCVIKKEGRVDIGSYAVGWCKNGPKGVLDQTLLTCEQTLNNIRIHLKQSLLEGKPIPSQPQRFISFQKYQQLREIELGLGNKEKMIKKKLSSLQLAQFFGI